MHFKTLEGRKTVALKKRFDEPLIITLKSKETYAGLVDECYYNGGWLVALYSCKLLDEANHQWIDHDIFARQGNRRIRDPLPEFWIDQVKRMEVLSGDLGEDVDFEDALQLYIDPHHKPLPHVKCNWGTGRSHSVDCEARLHEALSFLHTQSEESILSSSEDKRSLETRINLSFDAVRRRLLRMGARIP